jgi:serine phosphatase RsbU (regulator of sigma subunit)
MPIGELPGRRIIRGETGTPQLVRWVRPGTKEQCWAMIKASPLYEDDGTLVGAVNVFEDVTEDVEANVAAQLLDDAARTLASSLDYAQTLQHVAQLAVPTLADWCSVYLQDRRGGIVQVAVAHVHEDRVAVLHELQARYPIDPRSRSGIARVVRDGTTLLTRELTDAILAKGARDEQELELLRAVGLRATLLVPLEVAGRVIGALTLGMTDPGRTFSEADVALAEELGRRAGAAVHNAWMYTERGEITHVLQASLLPQELPTIAGWATALHHEAAGEANEVGGDTYDVQEAGDGRWLVLVGDVVGKGATAAALTPRLRHTLTTATALTGDPAAGLELLDRALAAEGDPERAACTVAAVVLDQEGGARITCAGHPPPLLVRGGQVQPVGAPGPMVGLTAGELTRPVTELVLEPGEALVLYTDGVTDALGPEGRFGLGGLTAALAGARPGATAQELVLAASAAVAAFRTDGSAQDDAVLLVVERRPQRE